MRHRAFGGFATSVIGQGTWNLETVPRARALDALRAGLDAGMSHVDTAEMYGQGRVEEIVGEAIRGRRDDVFLVSKVLPSNASHQGTIEACHRSLQRLGTDHLDAYLLHWESSHPLEETVAAFEELVHAGKILSWGVSNFDADRVAEAIQLGGRERAACNQVLYHLDERSIEHAVLPFCEEQNVAVVAYSPFGQGDFPRSGSAGRSVLDEIGAEHDASAYQVALAYLIRRESVFAIPMTSSPDHARENAAAAHVELSPAAIDRLERSFPRGPRRSGVATL